MASAAKNYKNVLLGKKTELGFTLRVLFFLFKGVIIRQEYKESTINNHGATIKFKKFISSPFSVYLIFKNPFSKASMINIFSPTANFILIYFCALSILIIVPSPNFAWVTTAPTTTFE